MPPGLGSLPSSISLTLCLSSCGFCIDKTHGVGLGGWEEHEKKAGPCLCSGTAPAPPSGAHLFFWHYTVWQSMEKCVLLTALFVTHLPSHFYVMWWSWFCGAVLVWLTITWWEFLRRFWWCLLKKCHQAPVELIKFPCSHCVDTAWKKCIPHRFICPILYGFLHIVCYKSNCTFLYTEKFTELVIEKISLNTEQESHLWKWSFHTALRDTTRVPMVMELVFIWVCYKMQLRSSNAVISDSFRAL